MTKASAHFLALFVACSMLSTVAPSQAQNRPTGWLGAHASSEGLQVEAGRQFGPKLGARLFAAAYEIDRDFTAGSVDYAGTLDLQSFGLLLDYSPAGNSFHLTVGVVASQHQALGTAPVLDLARSQLDLELLDRAVQILGPGFDYGTLDGKADYSGIVPYVGLGWRTGSGRRGLGFSADLGVAFLGDPEVTVDLNSALPIDLVPGGREILDAFLVDQQRLIENELDDYRIFPVLRVGLVYRY